MLNRRILRIKAMQALYSYFVMRESMKEVVEEDLIGKYKLDPAVHDFKDKEIFEERIRQIRSVFKEDLKSGTVQTDHELEDSVVADINKTISTYYSLLDREKGNVKEKMVKEADNIYNSYLKILSLVPEFAFVEKQEKAKREEKGNVPNNWGYNLISNALIEGLDKSVPNDQKVTWASEIEQLRTWYKDVLEKNEIFITYQSLVNPSPEEDKTFLQSFFKKVVFKNELFESYFMENDLHWHENKSILQNLVIKTIKGFNSGDGDHSLHLMQLSLNKEDDFYFFEKLYDETIQRNDQLEEIIEKKTRNWDLTRIANLDMVILKMALTEMMVFPSIPVKVTINEFIDISKVYSTPKSKQFINGILDVLANELTSEKIIRKSGRGLIDNK